MDSEISKHVLFFSNQINPEVQTLLNICILSGLDLLDFAPHEGELRDFVFEGPEN